MGWGFCLLPLYLAPALSLPGFPPCHRPVPLCVCNHIVEGPSCGSTGRARFSRGELWGWCADQNPGHAFSALQVQGGSYARLWECRGYSIILALTCHSQAILTVTIMAEAPQG